MAYHGSPPAALTDCRPRKPTSVQAAAVRTGMAVSSISRSVGGYVMRGARRPPHWLAVDSPPWLQEQAAAGRGPPYRRRTRAAPRLIPEACDCWQPPLCKRAEGMEFLGSGLTVKARVHFQALSFIEPAGRCAGRAPRGRTR